MEIENFYWECYQRVYSLSGSFSYIASVPTRTTDNSKYEHWVYESETWTK